MQGKRFLKKISAKRLQENSSQQHEHPKWAAFGLGLQDANGALRSELIQLEDTIPRAKVDFPLDFSLHRNADDDLRAEIPPNPESSSEEEHHASSYTCTELYGGCKKHQKYHNLAKTFVRSLKSLTVDNSLQCGTVIGLKPSSDKAPNVGERYFFLGVLVKKPLVQILARAKHCGSSFCLLEVSSSGSGFVAEAASASQQLPEFTTSHMVLHQIIELCNGDVSSMTVTVFQTTFETSLWGLQDVRVSIIGPPSEFKIGVDFAPKERKKVSFLLD